MRDRPGGSAMSDPIDMQKMMQEALAALRLDPGKMQETLQAQAGLGEEFSRLALGAAEKSAELSAKFTQATLARLGEVTSAKAAPADYGKAMQEFAEAQSDLVHGQVAAFTQILREVQTQTVELMMQAARTAQVQGAAAMKTAGSAKGKPDKS
jgi:hypothetical protein